MLQCRRTEDRVVLVRVVTALLFRLVCVIQLGTTIWIKIYVKFAFPRRHSICDRICHTRHIPFKSDLSVCATGSSTQTRMPISIARRW